MWHPNPTIARIHHDRELRTLYACLGASVALHGLAMLSFPALRAVDRFDESKPLIALFASVSEPDAAAPVQIPKKPRERHEVQLPVPVVTPVDPAPVAEARPTEPSPASAPSPQAETPPPESVSRAVASDAPVRPPADVFDSSLLDAYRLALIDAAKRYKRYPVRAMERGWEGRVEVRVVVGSDGTIKSALVKSSSRYQILDDQALEMVKRAFNALAQIRPAPRGREFTVDVPVIFELQTG